MPHCHGDGSDFIAADTSAVPPLAAAAAPPQPTIPLGSDRFKGVTRSVNVAPPPPATTATTTGAASAASDAAKHNGGWRFEAHFTPPPNKKAGKGARRRVVFLGQYTSEEEAAAAHDRAAIKFLGEAAASAGGHLNFAASRYAAEMSAPAVRDLTPADYARSLRRRAQGNCRGVRSTYRGVTRHRCGRWEARMGQVRGGRVALGACGTRVMRVEHSQLADPRLLR